MINVNVTDLLLKGHSQITSFITRQRRVVNYFLFF